MIVSITIYPDSRFPQTEDWETTDLFCPRCGNKSVYMLINKVFKDKDHNHYLCLICYNELAMAIEEASPEAILKVGAIKRCLNRVLSS